MSQLIMATTGEVVGFGRMIQAQTGSHAGTWWRLDALSHNGREHIVHVSRRCGRVRRVAAFPLHVFGLIVQEITAWWHRLIMAAEHKLADYMLAGVFALVPLAFFERFHGAEHIVEIFTIFHG